MATSSHNATLKQDKYPTYGMAITRIRPNCRWIIYENDLTKLEWQDEETPRPNDAEIIAEHDRLVAEWQSRQYQRDRAPSYPPLEDQLDMLYHDLKSGNLSDGTFAAAIEKIKEQYPKPE